MSDLNLIELGDRPIKLLLVEPDPVYRTGLRVVLEKFTDLQVVGEADSSDIAWQILSELIKNTNVDLVLLEPRLDPTQSNQQLGLQCRQLKTQYPNLPILLLSSQFEPTLAARLGVNGYCAKGIPVPQLVTAIRQVAAGRSLWLESSSNSQKIETFSPPARFTRLRNRLRSSGLLQIDTALVEVTAQLQEPGLTVTERAVLAGQRRELLASRWLVNRLLAAPEEVEQSWGSGGSGGSWGGNTNYHAPTTNYPSPLTPYSAVAPQIVLTTNNLSADLFASTRAKLQYSLENLTRVPLEIDIFREHKKRELLNLILRKIEDILKELRFSQVESSQLNEMYSVILRDLWQTATIDFFGRYSNLRVGQQRVEIVNILLQDVEAVQLAILARIPLAVDLFSYLLFQTPLIIDNITYAADSIEAKERAEIILQNLLIQVANGVVQPLLNRFADLETIKQTYYDRRLISTREIERFRNNLSWKYRLENYLNEPQEIFESRYELFIFANRGIAKISVYAPRRQELARLSGIQSLVTLLLELRDATAPRLRAVVEFLGNGVVYILTQVLGRAIGLVGRGILQGLGSSFQESKNKRF